MATENSIPQEIEHVGYESWVSQNPTLTAGYISLVDERDRLEAEIKQQDQQLKNAKDGIAPPKTMLDSFSDMTHFSVMIKHPFETGNEYKERQSKELDEQRIRQKAHDLEKAIESAQQKLDGFALDIPGTPYYRFEGLYEKRDHVLAKISNYNPLASLVDWRSDAEFEYGKLLPKAIDERLIALGWNNTETSYSLEGILDNVIESLCGGRTQFTIQYHANCWFVRIWDSEISFTRVNYTRPLYAIQRALISYLDARWDYLIRDWANRN